MKRGGKEGIKGGGEERGEEKARGIKRGGKEEVKRGGRGGVKRERGKE